MRDMKKIDQEKSLNGIKNNLVLHQHNDINKTKCLIPTKIEIIDRIVLYINLSKKQAKLKMKPCITPSILLSVKILKFWYNRYGHYRGILNKLKLKNKKRYMRIFFQNNHQNTKKIQSKINEFLQNREAVIRRCSVKKVFLKISQNSQENTSTRVFFSIKLGLRSATLLKKRRWHWCFLVNFVKFLRTPIYIEHVWWLLLRTDTDTMKISENGITFSDPIKVANKFNNHVTNIAQNLLEVLGKTKKSASKLFEKPK